MSALDRAADEQQARCGLAFLHNLEGRHEVINTLELIERSRGNNQGTALRREASSNVRPIAAGEHLGPDTRRTANDALWLHALSPRKRTYLRSTGDDEGRH